jgi:hypothetical protein
MDLGKFLWERRKTIAKRWFEALIDSYPDETSRFLKKQKDRFANPVGQTLSLGITQILEQLLGGQNTEGLRPALDPIIRIRAVQDFAPSQALAFVFLLKKVLREELGKEGEGKGPVQELFDLECRIDELALLSFDLFMLCREKIYELKASELKHQTFRLLERAKLVVESPPEKPSTA